MVDVVSPALAIRSSAGIELWASPGTKCPYEHQPHLPREETKNSRSIAFSADGCFFAYSNGQEVKVFKTATWEPQCNLPRPKAFYLDFSPKETYLCTWEMYTVTKDKKEGSPNMFVYDVLTGAEVFSVVQKNQTDWKPTWSTDETLFSLVLGGEAVFYSLEEGTAGFSSPIRRIGGSRGGVLSLAPGKSPPFLAFYTPGNKSSPSMCKLYKYPKLSQNESLACKSFFQADRMEMLWNNSGTGVLLLTSTEVDKSGASYYGNQALFFMNIHGDSRCIPLSKDGPVHCVKWSPKAEEFIVVYGLMPSKAAIYNLKCDVIFDFGEGPRNCAYFNAFGNLVVLAGFGNLPGNIEIWDMKKKERLSNIKVPDTTYFEWSPNGEYYVTATTAPRLRIGNGFKVYHYSGALVHETLWPKGQELLEVKWQNFSGNVFTEPTITKKKQEGIKSSQVEASMNAYTPPHLRLLKEGKDPKKYLPQPKEPTPGTSKDKIVSNKNRANKNKNNNLQQQQQQQQQHQQQQKTNGTTKAKSGDACNETTTNSAGQQQPQQSDASLKVRQPNSQTSLNNRKQQWHTQKTQLKAQHELDNDGNSKISGSGGSGGSVSEKNAVSNDCGDPEPEVTKSKVSNPEKEKKIRNVAKKLSEIKKLKARQEQGETLELNQLNKISQEAKFLEELKILKMSG